jgi:hypothetical protein
VQAQAFPVSADDAEPERQAAGLVEHDRTVGLVQDLVAVEWSEVEPGRVDQHEPRRKAWADEPAGPAGHRVRQTTGPWYSDDTVVSFP